MKLKNLFSLLSLVFSFHCTIGWAQANDWAQFQKYEPDNAQLDLSSPPRIVFMGNSITEGWMEKDTDFFTTNNFLCRGISGQTTYQMLLRMRDDVINLHPSAVVIGGGINDIAENNHIYNEDRTLGNIISMVELARANNINVMLASVLPTNYLFWREDIVNLPQKISSLNKRIQEYASQNQIPYIDYYSAMVNEDGGLIKEYTIDGCHPSKAGYEVMEAVFINTLSTSAKSN